MPNENRTRYSSYVKDQVKKRYPLCRTTEDKQTLADELEIGSVPKLYNLASRLGATRDASSFASPTSNMPRETFTVEVLQNERGNKVYKCPICNFISGENVVKTPTDISLFYHRFDCPNKNKIPIEPV